MEHDDADVYFEAVEVVRTQLKARLRTELDERDTAAIDAAIFSAVRGGYRHGVSAANFAAATESATPQVCEFCGAPISTVSQGEMQVEDDRDPWADWDERFEHSAS